MMFMTAKVDFKKIMLALAAAAALILALMLALSCCAFAESGDITLDVIICQYGPNTNDWFLGTGMNGTNFVDKFEAENPGIKLNLDVVSWNDVYTEVDTRIANNNAPDILNIDVFADYQADGLLLPAQDYISDETYAKFYPAFLEQSVVDGTVWAVPDLASARAMYYNKDILDEVGVEVPTTWDELEAVCKKIKEIDPKSIPLGYDSEANWFITMCEQYKSPYTSASGDEKFLFDNDTNTRSSPSAKSKWPRYIHIPPPIVWFTAKRLSPPR